jgi:HAD superfamily hydrolase (TIGR01490 family)
MISGKEYTVFFDLDRTIIGMNSGYAMGIAAYRKGLVGKYALVRALLRIILYRLKMISAEDIINDMGKWLAGTDKDTVEQLAIEAVDKYLVNSVFSDFRQTLAGHKSKSAKTAILSSAISEICNPIAKRIGIDFVICTAMESRDGILTGLPSGSYCYGEEKGKRLLDYCLKTGIDPLKTWYYADSVSDLPALSLTGNPVCVNPDNKLRKIAIEKKWPIENWK